MLIVAVFGNRPGGPLRIRIYLEPGDLGSSLRRAVGLIYATGLLPGLITVSGVSCQGVKLSPTDRVMADAIVRESGMRPVLMASMRMDCSLTIECSWREDPGERPSSLGVDERLLPLLAESPVNAFLVLPPKVKPLRQPQMFLRQAAHQSGDRYAIALTLKILPWLRIEICWDDAYYPEAYSKVGKTAPVGLMQKKALDMARFYIDCGIESFRISLLKVRDVEAAVSRSKLNVPCLLASDATRVVASCINDLGFAAFRDGIAVPTFTDGVSSSRRGQIHRVIDEIAGEAYGGDRPVVLFLLRSTGGLPGGAHPELDTRKQMVRQVVEYLSMQKNPPHIFLLGDRVFKHVTYEGEVTPKNVWKKGVHDMMQWWNRAIETTGSTLTLNEQLYGYLYLYSRLRDRLTMIGMRSGMLEAPAFMGIPTVYIDYVLEGRGGKVTTSSGFERMLVLAGTPRGGKFDLGDEQGFKGIKVPNYHIFAVRPVQLIAPALTGDPTAAKSDVDGYKEARRALKNRPKTEEEQQSTVTKIYAEIYRGPTKKFVGARKLVEVLKAAKAVVAPKESELEMYRELSSTLNALIANAELLIDFAQLSDLRSLIYERDRDPYAPSLKISGRDLTFAPRRRSVGLQLPGWVAKLIQEVGGEISKAKREIDPDRLPKPTTKSERQTLKLSDKLANTWKTIPNDGGGNCLFLAIAQALAGLEPLDLRAAALRRQAISFMILHFDTAWWGSKKAQLDYLGYMSKDGAWGGDLEIAALSLTLGRRIEVYSVNYDAPIVYNANGGNTIRLYHNGYHYELMKER
ncbi:OTU domain-containing protein [Sorangium sp. So ce124]|uniref:OTU domain-containing protein n=1 Tax=Sorangium sp. So ce124 TaxID=3133280 RepID=UPI003F624F61